MAIGALWLDGYQPYRTAIRFPVGGTPASRISDHLKLHPDLHQPDRRDALIEAERGRGIYPCLSRKSQKAKAE
jgi:hypothetical protein